MAWCSELPAGVVQVVDWSGLLVMVKLSAVLRKWVCLHIPFMLPRWLRRRWPSRAVVGLLGSGVAVRGAAVLPDPEQVVAELRAGLIPGAPVVQQPSFDGFEEHASPRRVSGELSGHGGGDRSVSLQDRWSVSGAEDDVEVDDHPELDLRRRSRSATPTGSGSRALPDRPLRRSAADCRRPRVLERCVGDISLAVIAVVSGSGRTRRPRRW